MARHTHQMSISMTPAKVSRPVITSRVSRGSRKPTSSPVSEKTIAHTPMSAKAPKPLISCSGSSQGMSAYGNKRGNSSRSAGGIRVVQGYWHRGEKRLGVNPHFQYGRRDLNPHAFRHQNLNLACIPISPLPREHPV